MLSASSATDQKDDLTLRGPQLTEESGNAHGISNIAQRPQQRLMDTMLHKMTFNNSLPCKVLLHDVYFSRHYVSSLVSQLEPRSIAGYFACTRARYMRMNHEERGVQVNVLYR